MKIKKLGASKTLLQFSDKEIFVSYETPVAARLKNGNCIRTEENHSRTTQKQITQYFSWVKDKSKIKNVSQSYLDNLLGA
tara:strand:- start:69 stop:308 length:240 start_codon:yes stop_codon:yes gene_type:complete